MATDRLDGLTVLREDEFVINRTRQKCVVFTSDALVVDDAPVELYTVHKWCKLITEGPQEGFFDQDEAVAATPMPQAPQDVNALVQQINDSGTILPNNIHELCAIMDINDDNEPAPENVPAVLQEGTAAPAAVLGDEWGHSGICFR